ncbi:MAG: glycosyltransferase [Bacteroidales bacterium]|nr:glycosyltransferase [Bacteroidales bacterium]
MAAFVYLALYYALFYFRVARKQAKAEQKGMSETLLGGMPKVSIVIVAHNEAAFLKESMPYLLEQDYPNYEVVVVDYMSKDDTRFVLKVCSENYQSLKPVYFPEDVNMFQGKTYPLSIGIKSASGDIILLTEADCVPRGFSWVSAMVKRYAARQVQMVMGYGGVKQSKGLLNVLQQYDNVSDAVSWMGYQMLGMPYSGTGRNLSFRRDFFFQQGSFIKQYTMPYGADDLFVNQNATKYNTSLCLNSESFVLTDAATTLAIWIKRRKARYGTRKHYPFYQKMLLAMRPLSVVLLYAAGALLATENFPWQYLMLAWVLLMAWQVFALSQVTKHFEVRKIHFFAPLLEIYFTVANTILRISTLHKAKTPRWR